MWAGLALSYAVPALPPSFSILAVASAAYVLAIVATSGRRRTATPTRENEPAGEMPTGSRVS
jgi:zinc/manganese transport system permease protein